MKTELWDKNKGEYAIWCPGCEALHTMTTTGKNGAGAQWSFNGDLESPTFSPSLHVHSNTPKVRCHSFIKNGMIQFLGDSYHDLKGKTVELPEIKNYWKDEQERS